MTYTRLDPRKHLHVGPTGFRLAPSTLTLDDPDGSKIKVILFDVKYIEYSNSYHVGPNGDYIDFPWALRCMTLKGYKSWSQSFDSKYLENGDRYEVGPSGALTYRTNRLSIGIVTFDLG